MAPVWMVAGNSPNHWATPVMPHPHGLLSPQPLQYLDHVAHTILDCIIRMLPIDAGPTVAPHIRRHTTESYLGEHWQLVTPTDRQFGPPMQEGDQRGVGSAASKISSHMPACLRDMFSDLK